MAGTVIESVERKNMTATTIIYGAARLAGIFVSSASSTPTIKVADTAGTIVNTFTPAAATYYKIPSRIQGDLTVTISGTVDCTVFYGS